METKGHIGFSEYDGVKYEWYEQNGEVYRAPVSNEVEP